MSAKSKAIKIIFVPAVAILALVVLSFIGGSMTVLEHEIKVQKPKSEVFSVLSDLESVQKYNPSVVSAKYISPNLQGVGAARQCDLGKDGKIKERITAFKENEYIEMELYEHKWPIEFMRWNTSFKEEPDGTLVSQKMEYKMKFGVLGSLLDSLVMKKKMNSNLNSIFSAMKTYIEKS